MKYEAFCYDCTAEVNIVMNGRIVDIEDMEILCADCDYYREFQKAQTKAEWKKFIIKLGKDVVEIFDELGEPENADNFLKSHDLTREDLAWRSKTAQLGPCPQSFGIGGGVFILFKPYGLVFELWNNKP